MKKKSFFKAVAAALAVATIGSAMFACKKDGGDEDGKTVVNVWVQTTKDEAANLKDATDEYNATNTDNIKIKYKIISSADYENVLNRTLGGGVNGPDVFCVPTKKVKLWAKYGYLENIQPYVDSSSLDLSQFWANSVLRFRVNTDTFEMGENYPLYALPRDSNPQVIYYNKTAFEEQGIKVISVDEDKIDEFNGGAADKTGKTKTDYGIPAEITVRARGFCRWTDSDGKWVMNNYVGNKYENNELSNDWQRPKYNDDGTCADVMIFNNRIPMNWDESEDVSMIMTKSYYAAGDSNAPSTDYGYFTPYWWPYGLGVGGEQIRYNDETGKWEFAIGEKERKSILYQKNDETGEWEYVRNAFGVVFVPESKQKDYKLEPNQKFGPLLASQYDAFKRFFYMQKPKDCGGLEIGPKQTSIRSGEYEGDSEFSNARVAMICKDATRVVWMRRMKTTSSKSVFEWDSVAPPVYKVYDEVTGEVKKDESGLPYRGIVTSVASSTGFGIWSRSKNKEAAYKVVEFFCTGKLQSEQAKTGVLLPAYKAVVEKDYIEANEKNPEGPKNIRAIAEYLDNYQVCSEEYLPDTAWIFDWADDLNYKYREDRRSVDDFLAFAYEKGNAKLKLYTEQGYNFGE